MKPKPNHYLRMRLFNGERVIQTYHGKTAEQLKNLANCPLGRIYKNYNKGKVSLKIGDLSFQIDQIKIIEEVVGGGEEKANL